MRSAAAAVGATALAMAVLGWVFQQPAFEDQNFAFRDGAHFYYPLFQRIQSEWQSGRTPLWNPDENAGMPLAGTPTSSVFYPGQLVFALPLEYDWAYKLYVLMHVPMAFGSAYWLARRWGRSPPAAALAGLGYAFSGSVMFQHCNVIFLCGAAWLPLAMGCGAALVFERRWTHAAGLGASLAMMTLAGDPQTAYLAGLSTAALALFVWWGDRRKGPTAVKVDWRKHRLCLLAQAAGWAGALAAVQVAPSVEVNRLSDRSLSDVPRNLYEVPGWLARPFEPEPRADTHQPPHWSDGIMGRGKPGSHQAMMYEFSVAPWRWTEWVWPTFGGRQFPTHRRWLEVIPAEGGVWAPSLYMGLLPALLAWSALRFRAGNAQDRWMTWLAAVGLVGAMGWYAPSWLLREAATGMGWVGHRADWGIGDEVGGLYWLLGQTLPGFVEFRFPAKLLTFTVLGISQLSAVGFDRLWDSGATGHAARRRLQKMLLGLAVVSAGLAVVGCLIQPWWSAWMSGVKPDIFFGPLDAEGGWVDLQTSLLHAVAASGLLWLGLRWIDRRTEPAAEGTSEGTREGTSKLLHWAAWGLACAAAVDLAAAQRWMVQTAPAERWHEPAAVAEQIAAYEKSHATLGDGPYRLPQPYRVHHRAGGEWTPRDWPQQGSDRRMEEFTQWDRGTMAAKYHLTLGESLCLVQGTLELVDYSMYWSPAVRPSADDPKRSEYVQPRRSADAWGAKYFVVPSEEFDDRKRSTKGLRRAWLEPSWSLERPQGAPMGEPLPKLPGTPPPDAVVLHNPSAFPRAWLVHEVQFIPPIDRRDGRSLRPIMQSIMYPFGAHLDLRRMSLVETDAEELLTLGADGVNPGGHVATPTLDGEWCEVVRNEPDRVEVDLELRTPGLLVTADQFYPGWTADAAPLPDGPATAEGPIEPPALSPAAFTPVDLFRANRAMRGVWLPAGRHRVAFTYRPTSYVVGRSVSLATWFLLGVLLARQGFAGKHRAPAVAAPAANNAEAAKGMEHDDAKRTAAGEPVGDDLRTTDRPGKRRGKRSR